MNSGAPLIPKLPWCGCTILHGTVGQNNCPSLLTACHHCVKKGIFCTPEVSWKNAEQIISYGTWKEEVKAFSITAKLNLQKEAENALSLLMWDSFTGNLLRSLKLFLTEMLWEQNSNTNFVRKHLGKARSGGLCLQQKAGLDCISLCKDVPEVQVQHRKKSINEEFIQLGVSGFSWYKAKNNLSRSQGAWRYRWQ